jgi:hypothetical protein
VIKQEPLLKPQKPAVIPQLPKVEIMKQPKVEIQPKVEVTKQPKTSTLSQLPKFETHIIKQPTPAPLVTVPPTIGITNPSGSVNILNVPKSEVTHRESAVSDQKFGFTKPTEKIQVLNVSKSELRLLTEEVNVEEELPLLSLKSFKLSNLPKFQYVFTTSSKIERPNKEILKQTLHIPRFLKKKEVERNYVLDEELPMTGINISNILYKQPHRNDMAVLLVFFDYTGSARILMNYLFMREKLKLAKIPVFTLELVIDGKTPKISDSIRVYGTSYLFQKEVMIRLLENKIPEQFTKIACLDADILFDDFAWYDNLSEMLETNSVVQCFEHAIWLDITYTRMEKHARSCLKISAGKRFYADTTVNHHPGFGWAFTRKWYKMSGFYDLAILGSGDTLFAYGLMGYPTLFDSESRLYESSYNNWKKTLIPCNYGFLPGKIYHLYHGPIAKRQYISRYEYFKEYNQIEKCISGRNEYGIYELITPKLNSDMLTFFRTRDDDGIA